MSFSDNHAPTVTDALLVEWLDGELDAATAAHVERQVGRDRELAERVRLLRSARSELAWALQESETTPPPAPLAANRRQPIAIGRWLLAAAALAIVVTVGNWRANGASEAAENELLAIELTSPRAGWDLFDDIRFAIEGRAKTDVPCRIMTRKDRETDAQMAARAVADNGGKPVVPIVMSAKLVSGKSTISGDVHKADGVFTKKAAALPFRLLDVRTQYEGIGPLLALKPGDDGGGEDFRYCYQNGVVPYDSGKIGFVPTEVGEYRMTVTLRALAAADGDVPAFAEPLQVSIGFAVRGVTGEWSEPVDGVRARLLVSRATVGEKQLALAVQLRNDSKIPRKYSVTGSTMAKIPQPLHFDLLVDGRQWQQRKGLGVITIARSSFLPQPVGTTRSMIVLADYWQNEGRTPSQLDGTHKLGIRFHFTPSIWDTNDKSIWVGKVDTPPIEVTFPPPN